MTNEGRRCDRCDCWNSNEEGTAGECQRNPPTVVMVNANAKPKEVYSAYPVTDPDDGCQTGFIKKAGKQAPIIER